MEKKIKVLDFVDNLGLSELEQLKLIEHLAFELAASTGKEVHKSIWLQAGTAARLLIK